MVSSSVRSVAKAWAWHTRTSSPGTCFLRAPWPRHGPGRRFRRTHRERNTSNMHYWNYLALGCGLCIFWVDRIAFLPIFADFHEFSIEILASGGDSVHNFTLQSFSNILCISRFAINTPSRHASHCSAVMLWAAVSAGRL